MVASRTSLAAVKVARRQTELRELALPACPTDGGILRVEAAGVCGSDVPAYDRGDAERIMGHENLGRIDELSAVAAQRWGVEEGDRVLLEEYLPCGHCAFCRTAEFRFCLASDTFLNPDAIRYGSTPLATRPGLWGGFSEFLVMHPRSVLHRLPEEIPAPIGAMALPLSNGYEWTIVDGDIGPGSTVLIMGPGQQGLSCVVAAREAGAACIIVAGKARDADRLHLAKQLGADHGIATDLPDELIELVLDQTGGRGVDLVVDAAAGNSLTVTTAVRAVRKRGRVVLAAAAHTPLDTFPLWEASRKALQLRAVRGHSYRSVEWAIELMNRGAYPLHMMSSMAVPLRDVHHALLATGGELDQPVVHATILPNDAS